MLVTVGDTRKVVAFQQISATHSEWQSTKNIVEDPCTNIEKPGTASDLVTCFFFPLDNKLNTQVQKYKP